MTTLEEAEDALDLINDLKERALSVVDKAPYWQFIPDKERAALDIDGEDAWLSWAESEEGYEGEHHVEWDSVRFPSSLLFLNEADFSTWKQEQAVIYEQQRREAENARLAEAEAKERAILSDLQRKYSSAP